MTDANISMLPDEAVISKIYLIRGYKVIRVNIQIIRVFTRMREILLNNKDILIQLEKIERRLTDHDDAIKRIFEYLKHLFNPPPQPPRPKIGFRRKDELE